MKGLYRILVVFLGVSILALFMPGAAPCSDPTPEGQAASKALNAFAFDLYGKIRKPKGNLVFSPYSISVALAMAYARARGKTESQMAKALHLTLAQPKVPEVLGALNEQILAAATGRRTETNIANALWAEKSYAFVRAFLESIRINYKGDLRQLDFLRSPESSRKTINR
jgi:serpin B